MGERTPERYCTVCWFPLDSHVGGVACTLSENGEKRAAKRRNKHIVEEDYSPRLYYGALPRKPKKPIPFLLTDDEAKEFAYHGRPATLTPILDKALQRHHQRLLAQQMEAAANINAVNVLQADDDQEGAPPAENHPPVDVLLDQMHLEQHPNGIDDDQEPLSPRNPLHDQDQAVMPPNIDDDVLDEDQNNNPLTEVADDDDQATPSTEEEAGGHGTPSASA